MGQVVATVVEELVAGCARQTIEGARLDGVWCVEGDCVCRAFDIAVVESCNQRDAAGPKLGGRRRWRLQAVFLHPVSVSYVSATVHSKKHPWKLLKPNSKSE